MIIGICGKAQCGKDSLARAIANAPSTRPPTILAFADALRDVTEAAFGKRYETAEEKAKVDEFWHRKLRNHNRTAGDKAVSPRLGDEDVNGRRVLQFTGTEIFRQMVHQDFWLFRMELRLQEANVTHAVIPDVRFDNEAAWVKSRGVVIRLKRADNKTITESSHSSEKGVDPRYIACEYTCSSLHDVNQLGLSLARAHFA